MYQSNELEFDNGKNFSLTGTPDVFMCTCLYVCAHAHMRVSVYAWETIIVC